MALRIWHNLEEIAKVDVGWRIFLTKMIRGYESFAIRNRGCAEASDMAACTRSMAGGMAKDTVHWGDDHATVFGSDGVGFCGGVIVWEETSPPNPTETMLGPEHPAKQQHVAADSIAVVNSDMSFAIVLDQP
jgi:hypothetical protein